jgi:hypothetical protein
LFPPYARDMKNDVIFFCPARVGIQEPTDVIVSACSQIHGVLLLVPWDVSKVFVGQDGHSLARSLLGSKFARVVACRQNVDCQVDCTEQVVLA